MYFKSLISFVSMVALAGCAAPLATRGSLADAPVEVGIIALNDFHGALEPPRTSVLAGDGKGGALQVPAGGSAWLASAVDSIRAKYPNHLTVSAGDMIGATQLASSLFLDEPAIGVMNRIAVDFNAVGNHEFDRGTAELRRIQNGGCAQNGLRKPCQLEPYTGAKFRLLAANSLTREGGTLFPSYGLRSFGSGKRRVTVGVIGLTLAQTGDLTNRAGLGGVHFADEAETINALVPQLKARGADAIVVLLHQGGYTSGTPDPSGCNALTGGIVPILPKLDPRIDVIVSGHTHWSYVCDMAERDPARPVLLTSAGVYGQLVTDISLKIDPATHRVVSRRAANVIVQSESYTGRGGVIANTALYPQFAPRADIAGYVARYVAASSDAIKRVAGSLGGTVLRPGGEASRQGGTLGNLIADSQLAASRAAGAQIAFMNPFGIRSPHTIVPGPGGAVTFGQLYAVQPFANTLVTQTMTGAELKAALEQGFDAEQPLQVLSPSVGFHYSFDVSRQVGDRVTAMTLDGAAIDPVRDYRVTTNNFLANGGDSFSAFKTQRAMVAGGVDIDALETWLAARPARAVPGDDRVTDQSPARPAPAP